MNINNKKFYIFSFMLSLIMVCVITATSYAYFVANVSGNNGARSSVITSGYMEITYDDGAVIGTTNAMLPGSYVEKHFSVRNTGNVDSVYDLYLNDVINTFNDNGDLLIKLTSSNGINFIETFAPTRNEKIASKINIGVNETHDYVLKLTFLETGSNQDVNKGCVFSAKIDLTAKRDILATDLIQKKVAGESDLEYDGYGTLGEYGSTDNNLRYVGKNPDNYVYFNCSTTDPNEMNDETCEKWRIIGVMNNIEDARGNKSTRVKIMRSETLGAYSWNSSAYSVNLGRGINQWGDSVYTDGSVYKGSYLMQELNNDYLGNITIGTDGYWYNGEQNKKNLSMPNSTLSVNSQNMIENVNWNVGAYASHDSTSTADIYRGERGDVGGKICTQGSRECNDLVDRTTKWIGKIGLFYISDYVYSTNGGLNYSKDDCLSIGGFLWSNEFKDYFPNISDCFTNDWIYEKSSWQWSLSSVSNSEYSGLAMTIRPEGRLWGSYTTALRDVRPVVYLKNDIYIVDGLGSIDEPYKITM